MKTFKSFLFAGVLCCIVLPGVASVIQHKVVFDTNVVIDTTVAQDGNVYSIVNFPDCSFSMEEGTPQLPVKTVNLIIPAGEVAIGVTCTKSGGQVISLNYPILPVQKPIPTSVNFEGNEFVVPNKNVYSRDAGYPVKSARILRTNYLRGNSVAVVEVSPVSYNPAKNQLEVFESVDISIQTKPSEKAIKSSPVRKKEKFNSYLKSMVDNKNDVSNFSTITEKQAKSDTTGLKSAAATTGISVYCEYVVITTSALSSYFDDFIEWKKQKGVDIELVTVESIYQNYTGDLISGINDNAGKTRQFLSDAYDNGLEYALLGGTSAVVPIRYGTGGNDSWTSATTNDYKIPADLYYSDFDGDWNVDSDQYLGERDDDNVDYGAEIYIGRLLCTTGTHIQNWTNKLLQYEKNPGNGSTSYLRKAFYTQADELQQKDQATDIATRFGNIFTTDEIFEEEYNGVPDYNSAESPQFPTGADVINEINSGYGFVSWFNHGHPTNVAVGTKGFNGCGSNDRKKVTRIDAYSGWCQYAQNGDGLDNLSNGTKPFVLYTLGCETTPFDTWESIAPSDNLGAQITNLSGKGGPVFMGNTRYGWVSTSWYLQRSFTNIVAGGTSRLGAAEATSKGTSGSHYVWLSHNLIGCPETEMWTSTPSNFTNAYAIKCGNNVIVNTGGVTDAMVCVMSSNDLGASYWDADDSSPTQKTFYNVPTNFVVTITKHNYLPKIIQSSEIDMTVSSTITGPKNFCSSTAFEIDEIPAGSIITWNQSSNITRVSLQGSNPCTFSPNGSGEGWIEASVNNGCTTVTLTRKNVYLGQLPTPVISGRDLVKCTGYEAYSVDNTTATYAESFFWNCTDAVTILSGQYTSNCTARAVDDGYPESISCSILTCGVNKTGYKTLSALCGGFKILLSPNPTSGETSLSIESTSETLKSASANDWGFDDNAEWDMEVYSPGQTLKTKKTKLKGKSTTIQTAGWMEGVYTVRVKYKDQILTEKLVVKK